MKFDERLYEKIGRDPGFRVPDGYFDNVFIKISEELPPRQKVAMPKLSRWHKWRPYVYLAAMFAGIWCMMKVIQGTLPIPDINMENIPVAMAQTMQDYASAPDGDIHVIGSSDPLEDVELLETVSEEYESMGEFEKEFDYQLHSDYADIDASKYGNEAYPATSSEGYKEYAKVN